MQRTCSCLDSRGVTSGFPRNAMCTVQTRRAYMQGRRFVVDAAYKRQPALTVLGVLALCPLTPIADEPNARFRHSRGSRIPA